MLLWEKGMTLYERLVCTAHSIAVQYKSKTWEKCLHQLEKTREDCYEIGFNYDDSDDDGSMTEELGAATEGLKSTADTSYNVYTSRARETAYVLRIGHTSFRVRRSYSVHYKADNLHARTT